MESLLLYEIDPSETSKVLAGNIIRCLEGQPPTFASRPFLEVNARWLNGHELCDALGLGNPSLYYWALMAGQVCHSLRSYESYCTDYCSVSSSCHYVILTDQYPL